MDEEVHCFEDVPDLVLGDYPISTTTLPINASTNTPFPPEILDEILWWASGPFAEDMLGNADNREVLCHVNKNWRDRVVATPSLWCGIYIGNSTHPDIGDIERALSNSGSMPLHLCLDMDGDGYLRRREATPLPRVATFLETILPLLALAMDRSSRLTLLCTGAGTLEVVLSRLAKLAGPVLSQLDVELFPPFHPGQAVSSLDFGLFRGLPAWSIYRCSWAFLPYQSSTLTELELAHIYVDLGVTWAELRHFLQSYPQLLVLHLLQVECLPDEEVIHSHPCVLDRLTHLHIVLAHPSSFRIAQRLRLPSLHTLRSQSSEIWWSDLGVTFFSTLKTAIVDVNGDLPVVLGRMPLLERLDFTGKIGSRVVQELVKGVYGSGALMSPQLRDLVSRQVLAPEDVVTLLSGETHRCLNRCLSITGPREQVEDGNKVLYEFSFQEGAVASRARTVLDFFVV
ncbi:hypothetical protein C8R46DRAFT_1048518 [Mycena filopes]|nr:hypothetical protein C8R46DRAFT_1048518 [Mycena filopes]